MKHLTQQFQPRLYFCALLSILTASIIVSAESPTATARVHEIRVISKTPEHYCGWPTLTRRQNGQLLVVWSGNRDHHVCPFGTVEMMRSDDDGKTWTWPRTLLDGPIDDRDAGVLVTSKGSLLVTTFTSLAYESTELKKAIAKIRQAGAWPDEKMQRWLSVHNRLSEEQRKAELGQWMIRSTDGGITWSKRYSSGVNSPHGPIQLSDGRLLYAGVELWSPGRRVAVYESKDDGQTWEFLSTIPTRPGDEHESYHELHAVETASGKIVVHIRNHNPTDNRATLQCESIDGGRTWTTPKATGVWGLPSFLLRLKDGRLLMTYGYRRKPFGNLARISEDEGATWSEPLTISADGNGGDLGYPSTVELDDGSLVTVWYERLKGSTRAVLRQAHWSLEDVKTGE
ncbi:MAG: sialidase family protein [Rubripirellula sp.]